MENGGYISKKVSTESKEGAHGELEKGIDRTDFCSTVTALSEEKEPGKKRKKVDR